MMKCTLAVLFVSTFAMSAFANNMTNSTNATHGGNGTNFWDCEDEKAQACNVLFNAYQDKCVKSADDFNMMSVEEIKSYEYPLECGTEILGKCSSPPPSRTH